MKQKSLVKTFITLTTVIFMSFCLVAPAVSETPQSSEDAKIKQIIDCVIDNSKNKQAGTREADSIEQQFADGVLSFTQKTGWTKITICEIEVWVKPNK